MDKKPIIIIGSGHAALLHITGYLRVWKAQAPPPIFVIAGSVVEPLLTDIIASAPQSFRFITYEDLGSMIKSDPIIDICTPSANHREVMEKLVDRGFGRFLVEKPLVISRDDLRWVKAQGVRFETMQNYLFSKGTKRVIELIGKGQIAPVSMVSLFCKDRTTDSFSKRGFHKNVPPHVFTIELPHQLYLATEFLGEARVETTHVESMRLVGATYADHGMGLIGLRHRQATSLHFSSLTSETPVKRVTLTDGSGREVSVTYPSTREKLTSVVEVLNISGDKSVEVFEDDDMMKMALQHYYQVLTRDNVDDARGSTTSAALVIEALSYLG